MLQFRYLVNFRDDDTGNDFESGFQARRTKVNFSGEINKDWFYRIEGAWEDVESSSFTLEDAYAGYKFANGVKARWGQFKLPLLREELVSDSRQLAVERSVTNGAFTQGWSQGVELSYAQEAWRLAGAFSDGLNSRNTDFNTRESTGTFAIAGEGEYAFTARFEYMFSGNWEMFDDFTANKGQDFGSMLGVAAHWQESDNTASPADVDRDTLEYTADISFEGDSWNLYGAFIGRYEEFSTLGGSDTDFHDMGFVIHGGYRFAENTELFARWDSMILDDDRGLTEDTFNFLTVGLNQYYAGHAAKASVDVMYAFESTNLAGAAFGTGGTGVGLLGDDEDGEIVIRLQFQLLF
jgi:hypothetical protein